jgi:Protein of unknown function (DUF1571)
VLSEEIPGMMPPRSSILLIAFLGFVATAAIVIAQSPNPQTAPSTTPLNNAPIAGSTLQPELAGKLIADAQASFSRVRDYVGLFYRQERVNGQMQPEQTIQIRVRQQPFSVHMKWLGPQKQAGQEAFFVAGKNNNQVKAKASGALLSAMGFLSFDPTDPRIMATNRHPITEAGIGNLIERLTQGYETEKRLPPDQSVVTFADFKFLNKPVTRMESAHQVNNGQFYCHRTVVYIDKETRLPVRFEAYDWPHQGGPQSGELLECYSFVDVKFNLGLNDAAFSN